jgi:RNA ligase (TIGR02306 family)
MSDRKLATIRRIDEIRPIPDADAIEAAVVGGWVVVVKRDEFKVGDLVVYLEIDSWVPTELAPFLTKGKEPREFNGVRGERLRTVKLRGTTSQGLLLPLSILPDHPAPQFEGDDVTKVLGIQKWEAPVPAQLAGVVRGTFPGFIPKTDQERIQNLKAELIEWQDPKFSWEVTEKLDGSSMTVYVRDEDAGVCSRNMELKLEDNNSFCAVTRRDQIIERMREHGLNNIAIQGELIGEGIQGNKYNIKGQEFWVYDVYSIAEARYFTPVERRAVVERLGLRHVPVVATSAVLTQQSMDTILASAEGKSVLNPKSEREGIVFKCNEFDVSFKAISNRWLLKTGE